MNHTQQSTRIQILVKVGIDGATYVQRSQIA